MLEKLKSRKLWITVATTIAAVCGVTLGDDRTALIATVAGFVAPMVYVWIQGAVDRSATKIDDRILALLGGEK